MLKDESFDPVIFKLRIEMKNKDTHKISYILKMKEDLLLECGMDVHRPNRRKKLNERLADIIKSSPISYVTPKEQNLAAVWKKNTKYKSWDSFWKNNNYALFRIYEDGHYEVYSAKRSEKRKGNYEDSIKEIVLPSNATVEEIGNAVIDVFKAAEEYHKDKYTFDPYSTKKLELLDGSTLTIKHPGDNHFNDYEDGHAAEIYQCYCYLPKEDAESSAEFFVGIDIEKLGIDL